MSCLTCETTPPPEKQYPEPLGAHHIGQRFGHYGLGWAVLYRGYDVTLQAVEAIAGEDGWVEMRVMTDDGGPIIHPADEPLCPDCGSTERIDWLDHDGRLPDGVPLCSACQSTRPATIAYPAHVVTILRRGMVQIVRGAELISGPGAAEIPSAGVHGHLLETR